MHNHSRRDVSRSTGVAALAAVPLVMPTVTHAAADVGDDAALRELWEQYLAKEEPPQMPKDQRRAGRDHTPLGSH
jgi:hypothetical protein